MPKGFPDTITCPECKCGQMAEWSYCPDCGADLHHKPPKRKSKISFKDCGTRLTIEIVGDAVSVEMDDPDWATMTCEFDKNKFISAINKLG